MLFTWTVSTAASPWFRRVPCGKAYSGRRVQMRIERIIALNIIHDDYLAPLMRCMYVNESPRTVYGAHHHDLEMVMDLGSGRQMD